MPKDQFKTRLEIAKKRISEKNQDKKNENPSSIGTAFKLSTELVAAVAVGAIIGGAIANENQKSKTSTGIIGYENTKVCETKFKNSPREEMVYSYSTLTFDLDGQEQTIEFQKLE